MPFDSHFGPPAWFLVIFFGIFAVAVLAILSVVFKGLSEWSSNNAAARESVEAVVIAKRSSVSGGKNSTSTSWHVTFELPGGERREFVINGDEYGLLAEGDSGQLDSQGTRYLGFSRSSAGEGSAPAPPPQPICEYCNNALPAGQVKCTSCGWTYSPGAASKEA